MKITLKYRDPVGRMPIYVIDMIQLQNKNSIFEHDLSTIR